MGYVPGRLKKEYSEGNFSEKQLGKYMRKIRGSKLYFSAPYSTRLNDFFTENRIYNSIKLNNSTIATNRIIDGDLRKTFEIFFGKGMKLVRVNRLGFRKEVSSEELGMIRHHIDNGGHDRLKELFSGSV